MNSDHYLFICRGILGDAASEEGSGFGALGYGFGSRLPSWLDSGLGSGFGFDSGSGE